LLFGLNLHAQTRVDTTYYNSYGNTKRIHTIKISKGHKAEVIVFNQDGQKTESYSLIDDKKQGKLITYSASGKAMSIVNYYHDLKHGEEVIFFSNGKKKSSTEYAANYPFGKFRVWHESGILIQKGTYDTLIKEFPNRPAETNQVLSGKYESYFQSGVKEKECFYIKGKLHGKSKQWYANGFPKYEATYKNGLVFGKEISWYENGKKRKEGEIYHYEGARGKYIPPSFNGKQLHYYKNGKLHLVQTYQNFIPHGKWIEYSSEGKVLVEKNYLNGQIIGDIINYYENGVIREKIPYKLFQENGRDTSLMHGIHLTYYSNGKIQSSTTYARGKPYGLLTIFFENGNMERELFVFGALDKYALLREFNNEGQIRREGTYEVNENDSMRFKKLIVTSYHENGNLHYRANHSKGRATGAIESYYENGNLLSEAYIFKPANDEYLYVDNLGVAWQAIYYPNGALRYELFTLQYAKHGQFIEWFPDGKLKRFIDLNGLDIQWLQDGSLMNYQVYNNHNNLSRDTVLSESWLNQLYAELNASPRRKMGLLKQGNGIQNSYYGLNKKRMETHVKDGKFDQYFLVYNYTGDTLVYLELQNGILHGRYLVKNVNGTLHTSGFYDAGNEIGEWKIHGVRGLPQKYFAYDPHAQSERHYLYEFSFYETGAPERRTFYNNGRRHGWVISFHPNGLLSDSVFYQNDTLNGKYVSYTDEGKLYSLKYYEKGKRQGLSQDWFYKKDGKGLMREEFYVTDKRHGLAKYYHKNGTLQLQAFFKNGIEDSTWIYYDSTGEVSQTVIYENGKKKEVPQVGKCACKDKSPSKGFAQSLSSLLSDETDFSLWEFPFHESVASILDHCYFRNLQTDANQRSAFYSFDLLTYKLIKVGIPNKNGIKLWLNPCLHDGEESTLDIGVSFTQRQPQVTRVEIGSDRMAYVLPPNFFKPVKETKQSLLAQFKVPYLSYYSEGINFENAEAICMDDAYLLHSNYLVKIDTFTVLNIYPNQTNLEWSNINFYKYPSIAQDIEKTLGNNPIILNNGRGKMHLKQGNYTMVAEVTNLLLANNLVAGFLTIEQVEAKDAILFYKEGDSEIKIDEKALYAQMKRDGFNKIISEYNPEKKALEIFFYTHKP
jgi:antitoxin component YwqK of YwqJK toxin-antitoxin module